MTGGLGGAALAASPAPQGSGADIAALRDGLAAAGYTGERIRTALQAPAELVSRGPDLAVHERRLAPLEGPLPGLVRLLLLGTVVAPEDVAPLEPELLTRLALAEERGALLAPLARIVPYEDLLIAADLPDRLHADHVAGIHRPSSTLAALTVRRPVATALDVGTGNGIQAFLAARHAGHVVATDVNERALAFAEFSARLNEIRNVELRVGSFFEPVHGERFDLVVANPPYVISPESALVFRDSGLPGDTVSAELVAELPAHLAEDGFATAMVSWVAGDDVAARPREWLAGNGCDAWIIHTGSDDALTAAATWNRAAGTDADGYAERVDRWLAYYAELGIESIAYGTIVAHRRDGANWIRSAHLPAERLQPASAQLERMFAAGEVAVLDVPLRLVEGAFVDRTARLTGDEWSFVSATVRFEPGIGFGLNLDSYGALLVSAFDGRAPLRARLPQLADELGAPADELEAFAEQLARHLVEHGLATAVPG